VIDRILGRDEKERGRERIHPAICRDLPESTVGSERP
jgi:hypothetical protein